MTPQNADILLFDDFALSLQKRTLTQGGKPVRIGSRALEILVALVERPGELVTRAELMIRVWPDTTVDENALRVHLSGLRKALGDRQDAGRLILNEAGRGYRFVGAISGAAGSPPPRAPSPDLSDASETRLPQNLGRVIGRDEIVEGLTDLLEERRFLTIVGPGGIGKTTVAIAIARSYVSTRGAAAYFVDLAPLSDPALVVSALASQLGLSASVAGVEDAIVATLRSERVLLLFDNCEHLVDPVASLAEKLLQRVPDITLLLTSREPLRAEAEWVYRLPALEAPGDEVVAAVEAIRYSAVELFCERAKASYHDFVLSDADVVAVNKICKQLDGIPLALEMAAARMDTLGATEIAARLGDRFLLLTKGRRTALPRQKTLRATLEWSHDFLEDAERAVFRSLSVFRSFFELEAVVAVSGLEETEAMDVLTALVSKSLVAMDRSGRSSLYRLLDTTRHYAEDKLIDSGQETNARRAHASHTLRLFCEDQVAWDGNDHRRSLVQHGWRVDDLRAALDWALSPAGDSEIGVRLATASAPLWFHLSLPDEYLSILRRAIRAVAGSELEGSNAECELMAAFGHALWHVEGPNEEMRRAFVRAMEIASQNGDGEGELRGCWGLWAQAILAGSYQSSLLLAERFSEPAYRTGEIHHIQTADHMLALSRHFLGDQDVARKFLNKVISGDQSEERTNHTNHAQVDGKTAVLSLLMRILWLKGDRETALQIASECADHVRELKHDLTTSYGLAIGCIPVAFWAGRLDLARRWTEVLSATTARRGLRHWHIWATGFEGILGRWTRTPQDTSAMQLETFAMMGAPINREWIRDRLKSEPATWCSSELASLLGPGGASVLTA